MILLNYYFYIIFRNLDLILKIIFFLSSIISGYYLFKIIKYDIKNVYVFEIMNLFSIISIISLVLLFFMF